VIDGEGVLLGVDGVSDFDGLHSRKYDGEVQLYAFDCLALDGDDLRKLPLSLRKTNLARLLARPDGIFVSPLSKVRSGRTYFAKLAIRPRGSRVENVVMAPIAWARLQTGSR
jgi:bifunctional non-homologous end joining protein LigD